MMTMAEHANKLASDNLNKVLWDENRQLRRALALACSQISTKNTCIEIERGRKILFRVMTPEEIRLK